MSIWFKKDIDVEKLNQFSVNTMNEMLGIHITEIGENFLKATMPVDHRTHQAYGILHGELRPRLQKPWAAWLQ